MTGTTLTTLPPELRDQIYSHVLRPDDVRDLRTTRGLNLLRVSKQINAETKSLPFQISTIAAPAMTDSSTKKTLDLLHSLSWWQRDAIRHLDLQVAGSTLDVAAACKVLKDLRLGNVEGDLDPEFGNATLPAYVGDLRKVTLTISSRDIAVPLADCTVGLQKVLDVAGCEIFRWLQSFGTLQEVRLKVRLSKESQCPGNKRKGVLETLSRVMGSDVRVSTDFEVVPDDGYFIDELDMFPDSYLGMFGNVGLVAPAIACYA